VVERAARHVVPARALLGRLGLADRVTFEVGEHRAGTPVACDLLVLPLAFRGDRRRCYDHPPAPLVAVHDWIWRRSQRGPAFSARVSLLLLKRLNLVAAG
jgi:hypothetical protein